MKISIDWKLMWEAAKEPIRWFILSIIAFAASTLLEQIPGIADFLYQFIGLTPTIWVTGITMFLRAVDKYIYKLQRRADEVTGEARKFYGITRI